MTRFAAFLLLFALAPFARSAVVGASLTGTVDDATGGALATANVTIKNVETGAVRHLVTDDEGRFSAPSLAIGKYEVTAEKSGFASQTKSGVTLVVGQEAIVNLTLAVGAVREMVTVEEAPPVVSVSTEDTSGLVAEKQVKELPLNGRSYDELLTLNPGIVNYTAERTGGVGSANSAIGNMFAVAGHRPQDSIFLLNGIEYTSASEINLTPGGASGQLLGVDAVREFNVLTDTYGAEFGKRSGAQVSVVTASGTNQLHGSLYEFLRNSALDARNFFDQGSIPEFQRNEFGGALGGPIERDKTFIFGNYEGFRQNLGLSDVTLVPDNEARLGYLPAANGTLKYVGLGQGVGQLLSLWPVENGPDLGQGIGEAFSHPLQRIREDFGTTRVDRTFSEKDTAFAAYTVDDSGDHTPTQNPLTLDIETLREQVVSVQQTHVFSPTLLNTARVGFSRAAYFFTGETTVNGPSWVAGDPVGAIVIGSTASNAATQITAAGTNAGDNVKAARNLFTYEDHVNWMHGIHNVEVGAWVERVQSNDEFAQAQYGQASFSSLQSLLAGTVSTFTAVPSPTEMGWRSLEGAGYVEDRMKINARLEVTLGFRFESTNGWNEAHGRAANYFFTNDVIDSVPHVGSSAFEVNNAKFLPAPRAAIAWDPFGHGSTVIRAGFGTYYDLLDNLSYRMDQNAPFNTTLSLKNVPISSIDLVPGAPLPAGGKISPAGVQPNLDTPTTESWSFRIEQKIASSTALNVGYVGSHGYHQLLSVDANQPIPTILPGGAIYFAPGSPLANPKLANTTSWFSDGNSSYNALDVDVNRQFGHGLQLRGVYTFSKSLDDGATLNSSVAANAPGFVMYPANPRLDWGLSTFDVRNLGVVNGTWDLPWGHGRLLGGWGFSGIVTAQSGFPFTPQLGFNPSNNGDTRNPVRPSLNPDFSGPVIVGSPNEYFNPLAFEVPANGTFGNVGRDVLIGPGLTTVDFSVLKNTVITERLKLQFRAEFFNILNHANFNTPNPVVFGSATTTPLPTAGVITATSTTSRQIQFGLKLLW